MLNNENELTLLRDAAERVNLNIGDIIIDHMADIRGTLVNRIHHIDMIKDDIYLWEVKLFKNNKPNSDKTNTIMEEEGLKFSIVIGTVEWHSVEQNERIL
tara:strand:+ start:860 stop:1159 length:300 start_codon:yes stop_codon:yes gene_type:complete